MPKVPEIALSEIGNASNFWNSEIGIPIDLWLALTQFIIKHKLSQKELGVLQ